MSDFLNDIDNLRNTILELKNNNIFLANKNRELESDNNKEIFELREEAKRLKKSEPKGFLKQLNNSRKISEELQREVYDLRAEVMNLHSSNDELTKKNARQLETVNRLHVTIIELRKNIAAIEAASKDRPVDQLSKRLILGVLEQIQSERCDHDDNRISVKLEDMQGLQRLFENLKASIEAGE